MMYRLFAIFIGWLISGFAIAGQCGYPLPAYINGILTSMDQADEVAKRIQFELRKTRPDATVQLAYNQTEGFTLDLVESLYQKADTYHMRTANASLLIYGVISGHDTGLRDAHPGFLNDIKAFFASNASDLVAQFSNVKPIYNQTLKDITGIMRDALAANPGLYIITHSQGSLFANDALYLLDQNELSAASGKRAYSGTYFIAPAASSQLANYGRGYTKFNEDLLNGLGIGMAGNAPLFASNEEEATYASKGGDVQYHGMLDAYFNASGVQPFQRSYERITQKLTADLDALKAPCNFVESTEVVDGQTFTVVSDPVLGFDSFHCTAVANMLSIALPARQACLSSYAGAVLAPLDANGQGLPINYVGKCNKTGESVVCSRSFQVTTGNVEQTLLSTFTASVSSREFLCKTDQFMVINQSTMQTACVDWGGFASARSI